MYSYFAQEKPLIVVTGITGFIGSQILNHCINNLADSYRIRGTVRNPEDEDKMMPLYDYFGGEEALKSKLEIVHVDLLEESTIQEAVAGATFVIHSATPVGL